MYHRAVRPVTLETVGKIGVLPWQTLMLLAVGAMGRACTVMVLSTESIPQSCAAELDNPIYRMTV